MQAQQERDKNNKLRMSILKLIRHPTGFNAKESDTTPAVGRAQTQQQILQMAATAAGSKEVKLDFLHSIADLAMHYKNHVLHDLLMKDIAKIIQ